MIISLINLVVHKKNTNDFFDALAYLSSRIGNLTGCKKIEVYINSQNNHSILIQEEWESQLFYEKYVNNVLYKKLLFLLEEFSVNLDIKIYNCDNVKDLLWINESLLKKINF